MCVRPCSGAMARASDLQQFFSLMLPCCCVVSTLTRPIPESWDGVANQCVRKDPSQSFASTNKLECFPSDPLTQLPTSCYPLYAISRV